MNFRGARYAKACAFSRRRGGEYSLNFVAFTPRGALAAYALDSVAAPFRVRDADRAGSKIDGVEEPLLHPGGIQLLIEPDGRRVPGEHHPLHPPAAPLPRLRETLPEEGKPDPLLPVFRKDEEILEIECRPGAE